VIDAEYVNIESTSSPSCAETMVVSGAVVSTTITLNDAVEVFPTASLAVQLTVVVPIGYVEPDMLSQEGVIEPSMLSLAVAVNETTAPLGEVASAVISAGTLSIGGVASTMKLPCAVFAFGGTALSFATTSTTWVNSGSMAVITRSQVLVSPGAVEPETNVIATGTSPIAVSWALRPEIPLIVSEVDAVTVTLLLGLCALGAIDIIDNVGAVLSSVTVPSVVVAEFPTMSSTVSITV
jgi:hypothetical protein